MFRCSGCFMFMGDIFLDPALLSECGTETGVSRRYFSKHENSEGFTQDICLMKSHPAYLRDSHHVPNTDQTTLSPSVAETAESVYAKASACHGNGWLLTDDTLGHRRSICFDHNCHARTRTSRGIFGSCRSV